MYILDRLLMYLYNIIFLENSLNNFKNKLNQMFSRKSSGLKMVLDNYNQKKRINIFHSFYDYFCNEIC